MALRLHVEWDTSASDGAAKLYNMGENGTNKLAVTLPTDTKGTDTLPVFALDNDRMYIAGTFSEIIVYNEYGEAEKAGMEAPGEAAVITASGSGTLTGVMVPYITFAHIADDGTVLAESNPAIGEAVSFSGAASRAWADIPASGPERATHVRGYVSVAGALPRLSFTRAIGTTSVTDSMTTAYLAQQPALPNDGGSVVLNRLPPPYCKYIYKAKRRMFYAGDPNHPPRS